MTGDLWEMDGGTTGLAVGAHRRDQSFAQEWDTISKQTGLWGFNGAAALLDFSGDRTTDAFFAELAMFPTETVEIQLAARHEDTGDLDSSDPKIGVLWTPTDRLFIRASAGTSFRQPGEIQMFGRGPGGATTDPVGGQAIQARGFVTGNLGLRPETSENWTTGVTWDATDRFTVELNYWNVKFEDIINQETASAIWLQDRADGFITDPRIVLAAGAPNEVCEVTGRWNGQATTPLPAGCLTGVNVVLFNTTYVNQAFQETSGVDYNFSYNWEALGSEWTARLLGSWTQTYDMMVGNQIIDGVGGYNAATFGSPNPEFRTNLMVDWLRGSHRARVTWRHLSKLHLTAAETTAASRLTEQKDFLTVDALYNYALPNGRSDVTRVGHQLARQGRSAASWRADHVDRRPLRGPRPSVPRGTQLGVLIEQSGRSADLGEEVAEQLVELRGLLEHQEMARSRHLVNLARSGKRSSSQSLSSSCEFSANRPSTGTFTGSALRHDGSNIALIAPVAVLSGAPSIIFKMWSWSAGDVDALNMPRIMPSRAVRPSAPVSGGGVKSNAAPGTKTAPSTTTKPATCCGYIC